VKRRESWPLAANAQQAGKVSRIGFLRIGPPPPAFIEGFRQELREFRPRDCGVPDSG
jgi:hypothetical protein